jgi:ABC-type multidrug transport system permease subunit
MRERASGLYETFPFFLSKLVIEAPLGCFFSLILSSIVYFMAGLVDDAEHFFIFYATIAILNLLALSLFNAIGSGAPNAKVAQIFAPMLVCPFLKN